MFGPSPIRFTCPSCGKKLQAPANSTGAESCCPGCQVPIIVPSSSGTGNQNLAANVLTLIGILLLVLFTVEGIERARRKREIRALESPGAGSAGAPEAAMASEPGPPPSTEVEKASADALLPATSPGPRPFPVSELDPETNNQKQADVGTTEKPVVSADSSASDPFTSAPEEPAPAATSKDLAAATSELAEVTAEIKRERQRWKDALTVINELTANKTRPVREGSPAYHRCREASEVMQEVETRAPALKSTKAWLEARIKALEP